MNPFKRGGDIERRFGIVLPTITMKELSEQDIAELLRPLCPFYYWPNNGNLGDLLIAEATRQWFEREGLEYKEFDDGTLPADSQYNLVYGGGGRFTNHWPGVDAIARLLTAPQVRHCVILPHSLYCVDDFVRSLDERHTIICREKRSYEYCCGLSPRASVALGNDMALLAGYPSLFQRKRIREILRRRSACMLICRAAPRLKWHGR